MATLNISGHRVKVDDSFLSLSPEQQNATVDEIAGQLGVSMSTSTAAPDTDTEGHVNIDANGNVTDYSLPGDPTPEFRTNVNSAREKDREMYGDPGIARTINAGLSAANRGFYGTLDLPVHLANSVASALGADSNYFGRGLAVPALEAIGAVRPPDPENPTIEAVGSNFGAGLGAVTGAGALANLAKGASLTNALGNSAPVRAADTVLSSVGNAARNSGARPGALVAGEAAASAGSTAGSALGGSLGESAAGERGGQLGESLGSILGGMSPALAVAGVTRAPLQFMARGADEGISSSEVYDALKSSGIDASGGLVGNRNTSRIENMLANVPIVGGPVANKQSRQVRQFGEAVQDTAGRIRGYKTNIPPDADSIGNKIQGNVKDGMSILSERIDALEGNLAQRALRAQTAVDVKDVKSELARLHGKSTPKQQAILEDAARDLNKMRTVPIDNDLHKRLTQQQKILKRNLSSAQKAAAEAPQDKALKAKVKSLRQNLNDVAARIDANLGVDYTRMRAWRTEVGTKTQEGGIKGGAMKRTYGAATKSVQDFADRAGMRSDFDDLMEAEAELYMRKGNLSEGGDIPMGRKIVGLPSGKDVYAATINAGVQAPEKLDVVRRNMTPDQWNEVAADTIEHMGLAKPGSQTVASEFSPETFLTNWNKLSRRSKEILAGDEAEALEKLATAAKAFRGRSAAGNPSGSGYVGLTGALGAGLVAAPLKTTGALAAGYGSGLAVSSEWFARQLARTAPKLAERLAPRILGQAGRSAQEDNEE